MTWVQSLVRKLKSLKPHNMAKRKKKKCTIQGYTVKISLSQCSVQSLSLFETPWTAACQASLSITNSQSLLKPTSIKSVLPSNNLILCHPLLLLPSIFPKIRVFSKESALLTRWPKYWSFSFSISPSKEYSRLISLRIDEFYLLAVQGTLKSLSPKPFNYAPQKQLHYCLCRANKCYFFKVIINSL